MKVLPILLVFLLFFSCNQENVRPTLANQKEPKPTPVDTISNETFQQWTGLWDTLGKGFTDTLLVKYFDLPIIDLAEVLGETPAKSRFFNGLEDLGGGHYEPHLIVAGVDSVGQIVGPYFDVSSPCPYQCNN